ncbi:MAG: shikimate dehydrogenase [Actinomycetota bacterium]|nr:shikimate dehydrogenase [Actinomycetota bacterium]
MSVEGSRLRLVLLGDPVVHSRSPAIHRAALAATGIDGSYEVRQVDCAGLDAALSELRSGVIDGANVTMPHKAGAAELVDVLAEDAGRAGAVNTIGRVDGRLFGWNTDVAAMGTAIGSMPSGVVLILGSGSAAASAAVALQGRAFRISARRQEAARRLAYRLGAQGTVPWGMPLAGALLVNATPLGMLGEALPEAVVGSATGLIDLPYGARPTPAVGEAGRRGIPVVDGIDLLVAQAAESFTIWTGLEAPVAVMAQAARGG